MAKALEELDAAMLNRDAQVAVMVFARASHAPISGRPLRAFHGNRLMVVWDRDEQDTLALEICCQLARSLSIVSDRDDLPLDRTLLADRLAKLLIERASDIRRGIRSARRGLDGAEDAYGAMTDEASALLYELQDKL